MNYSLVFLLALSATFAQAQSQSTQYQDNGAENLGLPEWQKPEPVSSRVRPWTPNADAGVARSANTSVTMYHNDLQRTGQNLTETQLTPQTVNPSNFGKIAALTVAGQTYAQPLVATVPVRVNVGQTTRFVDHNVVFVATEHDQVYAFDADTLNPNPIWRRNFLAGATAVLPDVPCANSPCTTPDYTDVIVPNVSPEVGITATPVIDLNSNTIYVTALTKENDTVKYHWRIHALNMQTGEERAHSPMEITGSVPGTGAGSGEGGMVGQIPFNPIHQLSRAGLVLNNNILYIAFTSFDDLEQTHGWMFAYDPGSLSQLGEWMTTPNTGDGTIWQSGGAPAVDTDGSLFFATGNGDPIFAGQGASADLSDSVVKLKYNASTAYGFDKLDSFTPTDWSRLANQDVDLGSGGVLILPDQPGDYKHVLLAGGKEGTLFLLNRDDLGGLGTGQGGANRVVYENDFVVPGNTNYTGLFGTPTYFNGKVYLIPTKSYLISVPVGFDNTNNKVMLDWDHKTSTGVIPLPGATTTPTPGPYYISHRGATASISANGNSDGIIWYIDSGAYTYSWSGSVGVYSWNGTSGSYTTAPVAAPATVTGDGSAVLYAFDANDITHGPLYSSNMVNYDAAGNAVKFTVPTVANGMVFVGTDGELSVYGIAPQATAIENIKDPTRLILYPNPVPASTLLTVTSPNMELGSQKVSVVDIIGQTVVAPFKADFTNGAAVQVDVSILANGTYVLVIDAEDGSQPIARKFIVGNK